MSTFILNFSCPDQPGIVHTVTQVLAERGANIEESQQYSSPSQDPENPEGAKFFMRIEFTSNTSFSDIEKDLQSLEKTFSSTRGNFEWNLFDTDKKTRSIVMVSHDGHCLNDLLYRQQSGQLNTEFAAVVSNHETLKPLAEFYGIPFYHIPVTAHTKPHAETQLKDLIAEYDADLTILARYMQILSDDLCSKLENKAINIHHSFLPSFKGARPYNQAYDRGVKLTGATAHYVTADLDEGPIIEQEVIRVNHTHTPEKLVELGRDVEARTLAQAVRLHSEHRVIVDGKRTVIFP